jgi:hypothetical protein
VHFFHITHLVWLLASAFQLVVHGESSSGTQRIIEIVLIIQNVKKNIYKRCTKILFPVVENKYGTSSVIWSQLTTKNCNMFKDVKKTCQTKGTEDPRILDVLCLRAANPSMHLHVCAHAPQCWNSHLTVFKCLARKFDCSWLATWCWENWMTTKVVVRNMQSDGQPFKSRVFCSVYWACSLAPKVWSVLWLPVTFGQKKRVSLILSKNCCSWWYEQT